MSDTDPGDGGDAGDSGFDKEAEREKLREKFARDEEKRESTRRMSELLLKGATMTNRHCDTCGDPLFRQNGQEFCVTCQAERPAGNGTAEGDGDEVAADDAAAEDDTDAPLSPDAAADPTDGAADAPLDGRPDDPAGQNAGDAPAVRRNVGDRRRAPPSGSNDGDDPRRTGAGRRSGPDRRSGASTPAAPPSDAAGDLGEATDALVAAVTRHATAGADADDPRVARDHLAAAREAAEALSALRR